MMHRLSQIVWECQQIQDDYSYMWRIYPHRYFEALRESVRSFSKMEKYSLSLRCYKREHQQSGSSHHRSQPKDTNTLMGGYLGARHGTFHQIGSSFHNIPFVCVSEMEEILFFVPLVSKIITLSLYVVVFHLRE